MKSLIASFHGYFVPCNLKEIRCWIIDVSAGKNHSFSLNIHSTAQITVHIRMSFNMRPCTSGLVGGNFGIARDMSIFSDKASRHNGIIINDCVISNHCTA